MPDPFERKSWGKTVDGWLPEARAGVFLDEYGGRLQWGKMVRRIDLTRLTSCDLTRATQYRKPGSGAKTGRCWPCRIGSIQITIGHLQFLVVLILRGAKRGFGITIFIGA
ncbi:hypothetical protein UP10_10320 [Bradyrhizobium sp. LTSPM299]|nr:hypothetical protein UP10_10320 [Bradyrhizobium sp. LTSPM299]